MKQIIIKGEENYTTLLTPKWTKEYYKRKGEEVYLYTSEWMLDSYDNYIDVFKLNNENNDFDETKYFYISSENIGEAIDGDIMRKLYEDDKITNSYHEFEDREDEILIEIVKEINDRDIIKIVEIPDDVKYYVEQSDCGFSESVVEKHRVWN